MSLNIEATRLESVQDRATLVPYKLIVQISGRTLPYYCLCVGTIIGICSSLPGALQAVSTSCHRKRLSDAFQTVAWARIYYGIWPYTYPDHGLPSNWLESLGIVILCLRIEPNRHILYDLGTASILKCEHLYQDYSSIMQTLSGRAWVHFSDRFDIRGCKRIEFAVHVDILDYLSTITCTLKKACSNNISFPAKRCEREGLWPITMPPYPQHANQDLGKLVKPDGDRVVLLVQLQQHCLILWWINYPSKLISIIL